MQTYKHLQAIVFDWAGTMIDHGSRAPASVFQEIFQQHGISITIEQAREPMGMAKRDHIATISRMSDVAAQWVSKFGKECTDSDVENMYQQFLPLQKSTLQDHSQLIEGAAEAAALCRSRGLKIGSTTGYTRELMDQVKVAAKEQGYEPDLILCAEDAPMGRPAPFLLYETAIQLQVYPMSEVVKVDDTVLGIEAGRNAGCWNIGISRTGNLLGMSAEEVSQLDTLQLQAAISKASKKLIDAGAHLVIESVQHLQPALQSIEQALSRGQTPADIYQLSNWE